MDNTEVKLNTNDISNNCNVDIISKTIAANDNADNPSYSFVLTSAYRETIAMIEALITETEKSHR